MADPITTLPSAPSRQDPDNFPDEADDLLGALDQFVTETNAVAVAMNLNDTNDVSSSSVAIGLGAKTFTVTAAKSFLPGMYLVIADDAAPSTNSMIGQVTSYSGTTLVMNITAIIGSGTKSAWTITQSVPFGTTTFPISGTTGTFSGDIITTEDIKIGDGKFIGSTSTPSAVAIDSSGRVLVGDTASRAVGGTTGLLQIADTEGAVSITRFSEDSWNSSLKLGKSRSATPGTYTIVNDNDIIGAVEFCASDGTDLATVGVSIFARVNGTPGANDMPTELVLSTTTDGSASPAERMNILANGRINIGTLNRSSSFGIVVENDYASGYVAKFLNDGNNANRYGLQIDAGADDGSGQTYYLYCNDGNGTNIGYIENNAGTFQLVDASDERTKKNIRDTEISGLDITNAIRVVDFERAKNDETVIGGFVAQELINITPEAVSGQPDETEEYEAERAKGNIVKEITEEVTPQDAIEEIEVDEVVTERVARINKKGDEVYSDEPVIDRIDKKQTLDIASGEVIEVDVPVFKTKKIKKKQLKDGHTFDEKTGKIHWKHEIAVEEDIDIRDFNRAKADEDRAWKEDKTIQRKYVNCNFKKTKEPVMGTRDKMMGVSRERLVPVLVKAIQELTEKVEALEANSGL